MKKMIVILFFVTVLSGVFVVYGGASISGTSDFTSDFSQEFRNKTIRFSYVLSRSTIIGDLIYSSPTSGKVRVEMDNRGGASIAVKLTDSNGKTKEVHDATGIINKGESRLFEANIDTFYGRYYYGYVDYRGVSTSPDVYKYEVTKK